jgi:signal transduction histidine kinase
MTERVSSAAPRNGAATELTPALGDVARTQWLEERDRVARELHDNVLQRVFATGVGLQALASKVADPVLAARLQEHIADLDDTLDEIRSTVTQLRWGFPQRR